MGRRRDMGVKDRERVEDGIEENHGMKERGKRMKGSGGKR